MMGTFGTVHFCSLPSLFSLCLFSLSLSLCNFVIFPHPHSPFDITSSHTPWFQIIKGHAEKIAAQGYRCLVPDLYHGKVGVDREEATHLYTNLDWPRAVEEMKQAVEYLKEQGATKVGAIGFCMGGALSLAAAQHCGIDCAAPFYGVPSSQLCQPEAIKVPVALHFGELDDHKGFSDPDTAHSFAEKVNAAGGSAEVYIYEKCGHAFLNTGAEAVAKRQYMGFAEPPKEQQELAWNRVFAFFEQHLKKQ